MNIGFTILHNIAAKHPFRETAQQSYTYVSPKSGKRSDFHYSTNNKFENDKTFVDLSHFIIGIDGVILNLQQLKNSYQIASLPKLLLHLFEKYQHNMPDQLAGEFCGFIFDKNKEKLFVFTNHTGSRKLYFDHLNDGLIVSSELQSIANFFKSSAVKPKLNRLAAYSLLTFGGMLGNDTLIKGTKRLGPGEYLLRQKSKTEIDKYKDYNNIPLSTKSESQLMAEVDAIFKAALIQQFEKDREYNYQHIATLSGGLDSRLTVMLAHQLGYEVQPFCFSQSNYPDEIIARKIAKDIGSTLQFIPLDSANHLFDFYENVNTNDGLSFYLGSAHFAYGLNQLDLKPYGLIHTGLIGDGLLGSVLSQARVVRPKPASKLISKMLYLKIEKEVNDFASSYASEDPFYLYNRMLNVAISGAYVCAKHSYHAAPFMHPDFVAYSLSIPPAIKFNQQFYLKWINQYHPTITRYKWERTGMRPTSHKKTEWSRYTKKLEQIYFRLTGRSHKLSMTPYAHWYKKNPKIKPFFDEIYNSKKHLLLGDTELAADVVALFAEGNVPEKSMVLTLLGAVDLFNLEV